MGALATRTRRVLDPEHCRLLVAPRGPECLMFDPWLQDQLARLDLAPRALRTGRAGRTIPTRETHHHRVGLGGIRVHQPGEVLLTHWADCCLRLPIDRKVGL